MQRILPSGSGSQKDGVVKKDALKFAFVTSLTLVRIPLILVFLLVNLLVLRKVDGQWLVGGARAHAFWFGIAFGAMVLSALTDLFDGYFARRFRMVTKLGGYADPFTDKVFYLVTFPTVVYLAALQQQVFHATLLVGLTVICFVRDQWVSFLRSIGALYNVDAKANWSGKVRTVIMFPTVCCIYWFLQSPPTWRPVLAPWFIYFAESLCLLVTLISTWVYTSYYWPSVMKEMNLPDHNGPQKK